jgi:hypothetical protein
MMMPAGHDETLNLISPDRRTHDRQVTICRVGLLHSVADNQFCRIKNISASGFMARVYHDVSIGDEVRIEIRSGQFLGGLIKWTGDQHVGVEFQTLIDVTGTLSKGITGVVGHSPRLPRLEIQSNVRLRQGGRYYTVALCDISPGGAQVEARAALPTTGPVSLFLPGLQPVQGTIRWVREGRAGIAFNESFGLDPLAGWVRARRADCALAQPAGALSSPSMSLASRGGEYHDHGR